MDKQAMEAREHMKALTPKEKWINFWYYYRVHVIAAIFVIVLISFTAVECAKRIDYDLDIAYYSSTAISDDGIAKLTEIIKTCTEDINYNGTVDVGIASCFANPDEVSEQTQAVYVKLSAELAAGDYMGYIFDEKYKDIILKGYSDVAENIIEIGCIPEVKEALGLADGDKVYWMTKAVYESEKDKENKVAEHNNALKAENMFREKGAVSQ